MFYKMLDSVLGGPMDRFETWARNDPAEAFTRVLVGGMFATIGYIALLVALA